jgi:hypothetical protein
MIRVRTRHPLGRGAESEENAPKPLADLEANVQYDFEQQELVVHPDRLGGCGDDGCLIHVIVDSFDRIVDVYPTLRRARVGHIDRCVDLNPTDGRVWI